eukprot:2955566-Amphidinium_carterae.2
MVLNLKKRNNIALAVLLTLSAVAVRAMGSWRFAEVALGFRWTSACARVTPVCKSDARKH